MRFLPLLIAAVLLAACDSGEGSDPQRRPDPPPPPAITRAELDEHLQALQRIADEHGGTRAAGTPGYDASVEYVAERLREARWRVERQEVGVPHFELRSASLQADDRRLRRARDFQVLSLSGSGRASGSLRTVDDGCSSGDFAALAAGEIPLADRGNCLFHTKAANAQRAGAPALVMLDHAGTRRGLPSATLGRLGIRIPVVLVAARALDPDSDGGRVRLDVDTVAERRATENVIAEAPGGRDEAVVMAGGHLDSVANGPGINDNGSGVAALIEVAEAIGPDPGGARVRLGFWGAEELGLHGSRRYVRSLDRDERRRVRAYLNFDMVGSPNAVPALYGDAAPRLARVLRAVTRGPLREVDSGVASDHAPFRDAGIPVNGLYTGASEPGPGGRPRDPCYHLACDTERNVDRRVLLRMARAAERALTRLLRRR